MNEYNNQHSYENGSTRPPKSHGGLIAATLCVCIALLGTASAVGIINRNMGNPYTESGNVLFSEIEETGRCVRLHLPALFNSCTERIKYGARPIDYCRMLCF